MVTVAREAGPAITPRHLRTRWEKGQRNHGEVKHSRVRAKAGSLSVCTKLSQRSQSWLQAAARVSGMFLGAVRLGRVVRVSEPH